jgi:GntR family transcriptional regulator, transcriptional repressor for pyruvate dehydrogenase complex
MTAVALPVGRPVRSLAQAVGQALGERIHSGALPQGAKLPTEGELMARFNVSRTVVREALSSLQAAGLVRTRHGVGSFVAERVDAARQFGISSEQLETLRDVVAVLELRIGIETEAAALAAQRATPQQVDSMAQALAEFSVAIEGGHDAVAADFRFHSEIAQATGNLHFAGLLAALGPKIIPRARLEPPSAPADALLLTYLRRVHAEHENIHHAIARGDAEAARAAMRTHLANSRERRRAAMAEASRTSP